MAVSNVASVLAMTLVTLVLSLFLLASGDMFYVKLIDAFPRFGDKKRALRIVYGIEKSVSRYLAVVTVINIVLGVVIGLGLWAMTAVIACDIIQERQNAETFRGNPDRSLIVAGGNAKAQPPG